MFNFIFQPLDTFVEGERLPVRLVPEGTNFVDADFSSRTVKTFVDGEIRFGSTLDAVLGLKGDVCLPPDDPGVELVWEPGGVYDRIDIHRDGLLVASLPGDRRVYFERPGAGVFSYKVTGVRGEASSFPATVLIPAVQLPGAFLRGDADGNGELELSDGILVLQYLFVGGREPDCLDGADTDDSSLLTIRDPLLLMHYLFLGGRELPSPGPLTPWLDPSDDFLDCAASSVE